MPEEPTPSDPSSAYPEDEWSDDSSFQNTEARRVWASEEAVSAEADWEENASEWGEASEELSDPLPQPLTTGEAAAWLKPIWRRSQQIWRRVITGVRNRVPAAAGLSDGIISGILLGILVILLLIVNGLRQPATAQPSSPGDGAVTQLPPEATTTLDVPGNEAPSTSVSTTAPPVEKTVDSDRIAHIQAQLTDSSILNASRVIDSVQADFASNRLTLICNSSWYRLSDYDQNQLAQDLMAESVELQFQSLQLKTASGDVLARTPVVGDNMVIFWRTQPPDVPKPERPLFRITIDR